MFDSLTDKLQGSFQALRGQKKITEQNIEAAISNIRRALLESDVSLKAVKLFTNRVRDKALGAEVLTGVKPDEQFIKIINDALVEILGGGPDQDSGENKLNLGGVENPASILLLGLQGAGKTTFAAKLALKLKNENHKPLLVPCDLQRPAAIKQLKILAQEAEVDFLDFAHEGDQNLDEQSLSKTQLKRVNNLAEIAKLAFEYARENEIDNIIFDTAGRLQVDTDMMAELFLLEKQVKPSEKLLVVDALIGQEAANVAETFNSQIGLTGLVLTKLDGDAKGGAALSLVEATQKPIKLASVGEKLEDLEAFYPDRAASRILGMGDVVTLVEKAQEKIDEKEAKRLEAELMKGNFNFETYVAAQKMLSGLGSMSSLFKMMGMGGMLSQMGLKSGDQESLFEMGEEKTKRTRVVINSMTTEERRDPDLINKSRQSRIARGAGVAQTELAQTLSEFNQMRKMFKQLGPMLGMFQAAGGGQTPGLPDAGLSGAQAESSAAPGLPGMGVGNPMEMMGQMMQGAMSKKQQKAIKQMGGMPSLPGMPSAGSSKPSKKKKSKKGQKPQIKGFRD